MNSVALLFLLLLLCKGTRWKFLTAGTYTVHCLHLPTNAIAASTSNDHAQSHDCLHRVIRWFACCLCVALRRCRWTSREQKPKHAAAALHTSFGGRTCQDKQLSGSAYNEMIVIVTSRLPEVRTDTFDIPCKEQHVLLRVQITASSCHLLEGNWMESMVSLLLQRYYHSMCLEGSSIAVLCIAYMVDSMPDNTIVALTYRTAAFLHGFQQTYHFEVNCRSSALANDLHTRIPSCTMLGYVVKI